MSHPLPPRRKRALSLKWELGLALAVKALLLYVIWTLWFDHPAPVEPSVETVTRVILNR